MDYDFRNIAGLPYDPQVPMYRTTTTPSSSSSSSHPMYGPSSLYPKISGHSVNPPAARPPSFHPTSSPSSSSGTGIRVALKPEYRITPPALLVLDWFQWPAHLMHIAAGEANMA
ncbi:unnamed protein product [Ilex paraguariensis]|uniref:Uncharacterized protein n=1 Tax=Ilex paraguariensis TaxID=185542 RepID=A0ABC8UVX4_9AQUA